jgi:hypothetical protein
MKSYYELLGASADDDAEALKKAFRKALQAHHPDLHPNDPDAVERFSEIIFANALLRDAKRRATYDWLLRLERQGGFQLKLRRHQLRSKLRRQQFHFKTPHTIAVITVVTALIGGWGLWATMRTSGNVEIDKDELAQAAGAAVEKHAATIVTAAGAVRTESVAADVGAETVGNSLYEGRNGGANVDIAPGFANGGLASNLETMVAAPATNYDRTQPVVDAGAAINLPLSPAGSVPAMKAQSVPTPFAAAVTQQPASLPPVTPSSSAQNSLDTFPARAASRQLTIDAIRLRQTDALLTISAGDVGSDAAVVVAGLAAGSTLSAGAPAGPNMWRLSIEDLGDVVLAPPAGFVGGMDLSLELRLADQTAVGRAALQLEWRANDTLPPPKSQRFGAAEIALMMEKGAALIGIGNVGGARMVLQHAAEAGDPAAALALAETYDPLVLRRMDVKGGITSDIGLANIWYEKAKDLGSIVASERLKSLAGVAK